MMKIPLKALYALDEYNNNNPRESTYVCEWNYQAKITFCNEIRHHRQTESRTPNILQEINRGLMGNEMCENVATRKAHMSLCNEIKPWDNNWTSIPNLIKRGVEFVKSIFLRDEIFPSELSYNAAELCEFNYMCYAKKKRRERDRAMYML